MVAMIVLFSNLGLSLVFLILGDVVSKTKKEKLVRDFSAFE